jgi:hypothetical protein
MKEEGEFWECNPGKAMINRQEIMVRIRNLIIASEFSTKLVI